MEKKHSILIDTSKQADNTQTKRQNFDQSSRPTRFRKLFIINFENDKSIECSRVNQQHVNLAPNVRIKWK